MILLKSQNMKVKQITNLKISDENKLLGGHCDQWNCCIWQPRKIFFPTKSEIIAKSSSLSSTSPLKPSSSLSPSPHITSHCVSWTSVLKWHTRKKLTGWRRNERVSICCLSPTPLQFLCGRNLEDCHFAASWCVSLPVGKICLQDD